MHESILDLCQTFPYAIATGVLVGTACALLGVFVILKRVVFIGMALSEIAACGIAGALLAGLAIAAGFVLGGCISLILVFIVNPQSFHWTMNLHLPWALLATVAAVLLLSAAITALISGRMAVAGSAVRSVREDW
jgi:ABC-type Mn2+/Zn2+ transport system permease subunit